MRTSKIRWARLAGTASILAASLAIAPSVLAPSIAAAAAAPARDITVFACPDDLPDPFTDIHGSVHEPAIRCMVGYGFINGTTSTTFSPAANVTRAQLASFLARALAFSGLPLDTTDQGFTDVAGSPHRDAINALAGLEIILGTSPTTFAPDQPVNRGQAASMVGRFLDGFSVLPEGADTFVDDNGSVHEPNIDALAAAGIVGGVTSDTFHPGDPVTRGAAASILARLQDFAVQEFVSLPVGPFDTLRAPLTGAAEVPGPGDPAGFGSIALDRSGVDGLLCLTWDIDGGLTAAPTAAHVHEAAAGAAGPVLFELPVPDVAPGDKAFETICETDLDPALVDEVFADPAGYYVNLHTTAFPDGAIRGQLSTIATPFTALMFGDEEVPGPGEVDAVGDSLLDTLADGTSVCTTVLYLGDGEPTAAHIHKAAAGVDGPIVVTLPPFDDFAPISDGCVGGLAPALVADITAHPDAYYVNIHTTEHPAGAVRGQLVRRTILAAGLTGAAEAPGPGDPAGSGEVTMEVFPDGGLCLQLGVRGIGAPTAAHIHEGPAGVAGPIVVELPTPTFNTASGCADVDPDLLADIAANPGDYYVNVHNAAFPAGAVRGQLAPSDGVHTQPLTHAPGEVPLALTRRQE